MTTEGATGESPDARLLGAGEFPPELDRVSWGAALLSFWWAITHGLMRWTLVFIGLGLAQATVWYLMRRAGLEGDLPAVLTVVLISALTGVGLSVLFGVRANRLVWAREAAIDKSDVHPGARSGPTVAKYVRDERIWAIAGVTLTAASYYFAFAEPRRASFYEQRMSLVLAIDVVCFGVLLIADRSGWLRRARS